MTDYWHRNFDSFLSSEIVPASIRNKIMRLYGYNFCHTSRIWSHHVIKSKKMSLGSQSFINVGFFFDGAGHLNIGDNVRIGQYVRIITATHRIGPSSQRCTMEAIVKPVRIGNGSWIGAGVTILPGVTIGAGCVIGANSLVKKSTGENELHVGNPAKRLTRLCIQGGDSQ